MNIFKAIVVIFVLQFIGGCYPDLSISPIESDTVFTNRHPDAIFSDYKYYRLADTIQRLNNMGEYDSVPRPYDQLIIDKVENNLNSIGYVRLLEGSEIEADVDIFISDLSAVYVIQFWNYIPYWYYYGHHIGYENSLYAYYPVALPTSVLLVPKSNIMVDMVQYVFSPIPENDTLVVCWRGITTGIYDTEMQSRLTRNIDQMFYQSPYLNN